MSQKVPQVLIGWTVLVVDDEEDSLEVAEILLKMAGATVLTASNGQEALDLLQTERPHFILSDLSMQEFDGWRLVQNLNRNRSTQDIPIIALTAHAIAGDRERAIEAGFSNYITKPLEPDKFIQQLLSLLVAFPELRPMLPSEDKGQ